MKEIREIAGSLSDMGFHLRTGGGEGADENFFLGHRDRRTKKIFLPEPGFRGLKKTTTSFIQDWPSRMAFWMASIIHPYWDGMTTKTQFLMARNLDILAEFKQVEPLPERRVKLPEANQFVSINPVALVVYYEKGGYTEFKKYRKGGTNFGLYALEKWKEAELITALPPRLNLLNPLDSFLVVDYAKEIKASYQPKNLVVL